jgi:hypothetical protein
VKATLLALVLIALGTPLAAETQRMPLRITAFDTHSGIVVTRFSFLQVRNAHKATAQENSISGAHMGVATNACVSFMNTLPRNVTQVDFHFVFYDRQLDHAGDADLIRTGTFGPNVPIEVDYGNRNGLEDTKDCVLVPYHDPRLTRAVVFVKSATFADGSQWVTSGPAIADHLGTEN